MMTTHWQTGSELRAFCRQMFPGATVSMADAEALSAMKAFCSRAGWYPWTPEPSPVSLRFTPPECWQEDMLDLGCGWSCIESVAIESRVLTADTHYRLHGPADREYQGTTDRIEFLTGPGVTRKSVIVTGTRGVGPMVPEDAYQAVLCKGALIALPELYGANAGPVTQVDAGSVSIKHAVGAGQGTADQLQKIFNETVERYQRLVI